MSLKEQIMADVKSAMKNKEQDLLSTLRFVHAEIKNFEINNRPKELTDDDVIVVLKKLAKQRKDSIEQYTNANRQDLADKEKFELEVIEKYLPEQMSAEQLTSIVEEAIKESEAQSMKDMGKVMGQATKKFAGVADGKRINEMTKKLLG